MQHSTIDKQEKHISEMHMNQNLSQKAMTDDLELQKEALALISQSS
jgi:hypothetical protein